MSERIELEVHPVYKPLNRPVLILGAEESLFWLVATAAGTTFVLFKTLFWGLALFVALLAAARAVTAYDPRLLPVIKKARALRTRYDPLKRSETRITVLSEAQLARPARGVLVEVHARA